MARGHMEIVITKEKIAFDKTLSNLDIFVRDFVANLDKLQIEYVIVSGYVTILFGRSRNTEDVDILIKPISDSQFAVLWDLLGDEWQCINTDKMGGAYDYLIDGAALRFFREENFIPNIELKFAKTSVDKHSLAKKIQVQVNETITYYISPIELQIVYKLFLGGNKDIEDAKFLYELFKTHISEATLASLLKDFDEETKERWELLC